MKEVARLILLDGLSRRMLGGLSPALRRDDYRRRLPSGAKRIDLAQVAAFGGCRSSHMEIGREGVQALLCSLRPMQLSYHLASGGRLLMVP